MEKFKELSEEKQLPIIEAALKCFGKHGYKKASMGDIAQNSGVSKPMLFHYFGTKRDLYLYLSEYVRSVMIEAYKRNEINAYDDLFERIIVASRMKMGILEKHPHILKFIISMFEETDDAVMRMMFLMAEGYAHEMTDERCDLGKITEELEKTIHMLKSNLYKEEYL